ncbi:ATP-dependent DNA helicase RecG [Thorsellia anophelis]|uniref:ATP-dependent DNA helicase RecG n=1 Tax=Thorsellia anophelis DSM 18579 TaxID=1123402 RepID=A0A1H9YZZ6_9GAMM|nr:ATP-dependent DNA helicase RecG [Thorsellia anophelis]SES74178.1 ATP-dependent DNA helicase RecG [Thorsellia anophelis DSM 18579]
MNFNPQILNANGLSTLSGVGAAMLKKLAKLNIFTIQDILLHLPLRYEDRTKITSVGQVAAGDNVTIFGEIVQCEVTYGKRNILSCVVNDGTGAINLRFFHFTAGQKNAMTIGKYIIAFGEIRPGKYGLEMTHPEYKVTTQSTIDINNLPKNLSPIYPLTDGLNQGQLRKLTDQALKLLANCPIAELLPEEIAKQLPSLSDAIQLLHQPPIDIRLSDLEAGKHPAQTRLILEEFTAHNLSLLMARSEAKRLYAHAIKPHSSLKTDFLSQLPFSPTNAQKRVVNDIESDLFKNSPMMRLVQGDVGSGKTLVAALSAIDVLAAGYQVALMAPTELLAEQHAHNFEKWFTPLGIKIGWVAGKQKGKIRLAQEQAIANGEAQMVIGTHAIFQSQIEFAKLALVIIDEQHRFGVQQRLSLWEKGHQSGVYPHQLIMTATPIPRTLAMTAYADLDTSIIDELPPGRTPITTVAIADSRRDEVIDRVKSACLTEKRQVYWVCTLIDESEVLEAQAAEETYTVLQQVLPELKIALIHGRLKSTEKQSLMEAFKQGQYDLLVATTVIEVGVDVPNASLMIIENPERLGLAQLHQLRGRVGRGQVASHCVLLYKTPLSKTAQKRLQVMRQSNDGFYIAEEDLALRGPGEVLGTKQTGSLNFHIADLIRDKDLIPYAQKIGETLLLSDPIKAEALIRRWLPESLRYKNA